jgi:putative DNA primase/helicase
MPEPVQIPRYFLKENGEPQRVSIYRDAQGVATFAIARWDSGDKKDIRPIIWDGNEFTSRQYDGPRPLYNADVIAASPSSPVLVVEGEKAAEDGGTHLPNGWVITTWAGGSNAVNKADWSVLAGRRVVVWPDNDEPGLMAAEHIRAEVEAVGGLCGIVKLSKNYPKGWDLADALPAGVTDSMITANLFSALYSTEAPVPAPAPVEEEAAVDEGMDFKPLGYDDKYFYVMPSATKVILKLQARELMSAAGCLQIINDFDYWAENYPAKRGSSSRADWETAASWIMRHCQKVGRFDIRRIRGRGVWFEETENRVVVNTGDSLVVDGKNVNPVSLKSRYIYQSGESLFLDGIRLSDEADDMEGRLVVELCNSARWEREVFGDLLAGYIATSLVCGGLRWRTHVWVTGNSGSGKSTVINNIVSACVGDVALYPLGETTESGIRQTVGNDALPVIFDEMEGTDEKGGQGANRRQAIISLMRMASSEGRGRIMKGSASHNAVSFTMRSSFLVASIGMSLKEAPDLTRTMVLGLKPLSSDASETDKKRATAQFEKLNRLAARIPDDMPHRLFARLTNMLPVIRRNAEIFREVISEELGNRRLGDQIGTLLAGRCALSSRRVMTEAECREYVMRFDWNGVVAAPSEREDKSLLSHVRQAIVRIPDSTGRQIERTMGELVMAAMDLVPDIAVDPDAANATLMRYGIKVDMEEKTVWIASRMQSLDYLFRTSSNPTDWFSVISRYPDAKKSGGGIRFAGGSVRAIGLPFDAFID